MSISIKPKSDGSRVVIINTIYLYLVEHIGPDGEIRNRKAKVRTPKPALNDNTDPDGPVDGF